MSHHFLEQVQLLMHAQQIKNTEELFQNSRNYQWLSNKRPSVIWISAEDEFKMRRALQKLDEDQRLKVLKQLMKWLEEHPSASTIKIPEICIKLLEHQDTSNMINTANFSRMSSFRNSLRRFSLFRNSIAPAVTTPEQSEQKTVTFNEQLMVYKIYN